MNEQLTEELSVKVEEPDPKRHHVLEDLDIAVEIEAPPDWEILPYHLIVQVYSYLKDSDRLAMAQVCQAWYTGFKNPSLWRSRKFTFGGPNGEQTCENAIRFASMFGSCLQDVVTSFNLRTSGTCIKETIEHLMKKLENATLYRLELINLQLNRFNTFPELKNTLCSCLVKMLKSQATLKHLVLKNCNFYHGHGTEVLKALQDSSGQTLESFELFDLLLAIDPKSEENCLKFELRFTDFEKFQNLSEISLHYNSICEEMLQKLIFNLKNKIQILRLLILDYEIPFSMITSATWRNIVEACPQLQVFLRVFTFFAEKEIIELLVPEMPLVEFFLLSQVKSSEQNTQLASTLTHIADNFDKKLEGCFLFVPYLQDSLDNEIIRIVEKCRKLTTMTVPASAAIGVADVLRNEFRERQVRKARFQKRRYADLENSEPYQDIVITFHEKLNNSPNLTLEWVNED